MNLNHITCRLDLDFDNAFGCFFTNSDTDWQSDQVAIAEFNTDTLVAVVCKDFITSTLQASF